MGVGCVVFCVVVCVVCGCVLLCVVRVSCAFVCFQERSHATQYMTHTTTSKKNNNKKTTRDTQTATHLHPKHTCQPNANTTHLALPSQPPYSLPAPTLHHAPIFHWVMTHLLLWWWWLLWLMCCVSVGVGDGVGVGVSVFSIGMCCLGLMGCCGCGCGCGCVV